MKTFYKCLFPVAILTFCLVFPALTKAQWNTNTSVNIEISGLPIADMVPVPTSDGKMWVAFYHENTGNYDMRAQLIDANGFKLLGPNGVLVSNQPSGTATYVFNACVDQQNNLIIGCQDERSGTMQAVLYKISQAGAHMWSPTGVVLGGGMVPNPVALTNNDIAVVWNADNGNTLNLQKVTAAGTLAWANSIPVTVGASTTTRGQLIANTNDKFTMVYQKNAGGISTNLYAQMFNSSGTALYTPLQIGNQTTAGYRYYSIEAEGDTTYFGYYSSTGFRFNSFLQRINPNGTIPWGMNGSAFNTFTSGSDNYQMETSIGQQDGSPYVWSVASFCDPNQTNYGVYVQKFSKATGARQFTDMGKIVYSVSPARDMLAGEITVVNDNPMFASYDASYKIYATRLDASGNFAWTGNRAELSSTTSGSGNPKGRFGFTNVGPDRCSAVWTENRTGQELGYAQGITVGGLIGIDVATQGGVPAVISTPAGTLQMVATVFPSSASQAVTWSIVPGTGSASINTFGMVTALVDGTVWAKAISVQDPTLMDSLLITMSNQVPIPPSVITLAATNITFTDARMNGSVNANNYSSNVSFEWGLTNTYGNTANATPVLVTGNTVTPVLANLTGLTPGTTYHFRCTGTNAGGTANGQDLTFTTQCLLVGTIGTITGPQTLCAGSTGNVYSIPAFAGATSYVWTLPVGANIVAGAGTNSITIDFANNAVSGDFVVYATNGSCNSYASAPYSVTVIPLPTQPGNIVGVQYVCEGEQGVQYSITPMASITGYVWTVPTGAVIQSGQNTPSIIVNFPIGSISGDVTVYGLNACGNGAVSNPLPVTVLTLPSTPGAITGPAHICKEASGIEYQVAPVANAYGYNWTLPAGADITAGANTNHITVHFGANAVSGNISVYGTNGNCLGAVSPLFAVTVDATPATPVITLSGNTLISSADFGNQWYLDGNLIPGAINKEYVPQANGLYTVVVTLNNCSSLVSNSINVTFVGLPTLLESNMDVYPNPSNGILNLKLGSNASDYSVTVLNSTGKAVYQEIKKGNDKTLDLSSLPNGDYWLILKISGERRACKIALIK
ncbi:MAG: T9SS type A sorting domain-containing protein [Bacteroidales bacterium]|nr:T9SS type A sorting domain-containing protein [Bacteroidales bacterium]